MKWEMGRFAWIASLAAGCSLTAPVRACTVGNRPANSVAERIAGRTDLRTVRGTYRIQSVVQPADERHPATIVGTITTQRGTLFHTTHPYDEIWVRCLIYYLPQADASGTFYLSRRRREGRQELVDWSGAYVAGGSVVRTSDEGAPE